MLYTTEEVADMLKVKKETVWGWIRKGKLPAVRPIGKYLVREEDLCILMENGRKKARKEASK